MNEVIKLTITLLFLKEVGQADLKINEVFLKKENFPNTTLKT